MHHFISLENVSFSYPDSTSALFESMTLQLHSGWTAIVGANGSGKTTLLKLISGHLTPDSGTISRPGPAYYAEQRTDNIPSDLPDMFESTERYAYQLINKLGIRSAWLNRWDTLSHGERKRCQIGAALFSDPLILTIDEPSNHLDLAARKTLLDALKSFRGIGLLVSHDRDMLDSLCRHTLFLTPPHIDIRRASYSGAVKAIEQENAHRVHEKTILKREIKKLKKKVAQQQSKTAKTDKLKSKKTINPRDHDAKSKKDLARLTGKDAVQGRIYAKLKGQLDSAAEKQRNINIRKNAPLGIEFNSMDSQKHFPVIISSGNIKLGKNRILKFPELIVRQGDKIGIMGDNGAGKSTFLEHIRKQIRLNPDQIVFISQEISIESSTTIIAEIQNLDSTRKGELMTIISRLGSDPVHLLETVLPTPGEVRKLILAEGILRQPALIIMDEPTNHMDLPSIQCVETALKECNCAQLLVSHDRRFLTEVTGLTWSFETETSGRPAIKRGSANDISTYYIRPS